MFLHTNHTPLNKHLHCIRKANSPYCTHCPDKEETAHHFLIECPHYQHEHHSMMNALGCQASSLPFLLTNPNAAPHLVEYVNATGRMRSVLGEVPLPHPSTG
ncbi:hypothetical protein BDR03DRAFT_941697 [Suillus americanus]|nr:hypothetical protein BDR03DRAFT_941697 [Suillus americanus]